MQERLIEIRDDETHIPDRAYAPEFAKALGAIPETSILSVEK